MLSLPEKRPASGYALEVVLAACGEGAPGAQHRVFDRGGHQNLVGTGECRSAGGDVDSHAPEIVTEHFALADVNAGTYVEVVGGQLPLNRLRTTHGIGG